MKDCIAVQTFEKLGFIPGHPALIVDADEVLVRFAEHLARYLVGRGYEMRLKEYRLEGSIYPAGSDKPVAYDDCVLLINDFFADQTRNQEMLPGAAPALRALAAKAQIFVLTNIPEHAHICRSDNLRDLGMPYPVIVNSGGKGRVLAEIATIVNATVAFVDDSPHQIASAARHAPDVIRIHFRGVAYTNRVIPPSPHADHVVSGWDECARILHEVLADSAPEPR